MSVESAPLTSTASDHLARHHHPNFIALEVVEGAFSRQTKLQFRLFTGTETEPERPQASYRDAELSHEDRCLLNYEYDALRSAWATARLKHQAPAVLAQAAPVWKDYLRAREAMDSVFAHFWETSDVQWKAQGLKLTDAHTATLTAARAWDTVAEKIAQLLDDHRRTAGEENYVLLTDLGTGAGIDTSGWSVDPLDEYRTNEYRTETPLAGEVAQAIEEQKTRLRENAELVGER
ncbi:hypothetical protein ACFWA9_10230 [Kitasatospora sp. NPDC059973]|uniref:hypothetical protein n=1 Tax=Kitasatospora sp. NPDC059973 TaxID=3347020 RepID=UPI0036A5DDEA